MKIIYVLIISIFCTSVSCVSNQNLNNNQKQITQTEIFIKYDGVYFIPYGGGFSNDYLRFFENGKVINVNSTGSPAQIKNWFNYKNENVGKGEYFIEGNSISFTTVFEEISIEYIGVIGSNGLLLNAHSSNGAEINGLLFVFYQW